ncbi:MAG TPA: hypothetical protein VEK34_13995 [Methylocella sp.]|nr:hypothetical protein [Methylocella sp.]
MPIDRKALITGLVGGVLSWLALTAVSVATNGWLIHWMGGLTKEEAFGGLFLRWQGPGDQPRLGFDRNPLNNDANGCAPEYTPVKLGTLAHNEPDIPQHGIDVVLCVPKKSDEHKAAYLCRHFEHA